LKAKQTEQLNQLIRGHVRRFHVFNSMFENTGRGLLGFASKLSSSSLTGYLTERGFSCCLAFKVFAP